MMGRHGNLVALRLKLDDEITYGSKRSSLALARTALREARSRRFPAETEYFKGQIDLIQERFASGLEHFEAALRLNPLDGAAWNDKALCLAELGLIDAALEAFEKGIAVEADFATIHHNKGWLLNNIGRHREALRCFERALALDPERAVTYDNLADARYNLGDTAGAVEAYRTVLALLAPGQGRGIRTAIRRRLRELGQ